MQKSTTTINDLENIITVLFTTLSMLKSVTNRLVSKAVRKTIKDAKIVRYASCKDGNDSSCTDSTPKPSLCCPPTDPPPCPPPPPPCGPPCPPPICSNIPDPNNPCNYVPPANPDPDEPDMTRIKRLQCLYQQDDDIPIHLKGGKFNVYFFHFVTIIGGINLIHVIFMLIKLCSN